LDALEALQSIGPDAKPVVAELLALFKNKDADYSRYAAEALKKIDPEAAAKAGVR
jgi:hypothetical protein